MYNPTKICVRYMARRAKTLQELNIQKASKGKVQVIAAVKPRISKGEESIVVPVNKEFVDVHHHSKVKVASTFNDFQLRNDVINGIQSFEIYHPTIIQLLGIPEVLKGKNVFCAAQTGSGKTFVYVVPTINALKNDVDNGFIGRLSRPRVVVIAPARELAMQLLKVYKSFSYHAPIRSLGIIGQKQKKWKREYLKGVVDVVVSTPDTLLKYHKRGRISFSDLQYIILDEADTLMDESFRGVTQDILELCNFYDRSSETTKKPVQAILTAATLPKKGIFSRYKNLIPNLTICQSNLHKVLPNVKHTFIKTTQQKKSDLLLSKLETFLRTSNHRKCIIFSNTSKSCNWISNELTTRNIKHSKLHGNMDPKVRFKDFEDFENNDTRVLVTTDIGSRGLNLIDVTLVFNLDCPFNTTDYIHRSGRIGRATESFPGEGECVTYITQNKEAIFAQRVKDAAEKNQSLDDINSKRTPEKTIHGNLLKKARESLKSSEK